MIEWKQRMTVGDAKLDSEHKELVSKINELMISAMAGKGKEKILQTVNFLGNYAKTHFTDEEEYMLTHKYPGLAGHKQIHREFIKKFLDFKGKIEKGEVTSSLTVEVQTFLGDWLVNHIMKEDRKYADFVASSG